ncbi:MAG: anti-sigma factor [Deltaproteobacteria bacterium]|nr:anti-sigma factor [Deltaproteobacteria bacterium]
MLLALGLFACGGPSEYVLTGTARSAGTDGMMIVEDTGGNHMVTVELEHLPPADRISQGGQHYVVWIKPKGGTPHVVGELDYDPDERIGRMTATTPTSEFELIISVERTMTVSHPSEVLVVKKNTASTSSSSNDDD